MAEDGGFAAAEHLGARAVFTTKPGSDDTRFCVEFECAQVGPYEPNGLQEPNAPHAPFQILIHSAVFAAGADEGPLVSRATSAPTTFDGVLCIVGMVKGLSPDTAHTITVRGCATQERATRYYRVVSVAVA